MLRNHGRHVKQRNTLRNIAFMVCGTVISASALIPGQANAATTSPGNAMLNWAEAHATGHWYQWGGTGPSGYDCSGLVYAAARADGIALPRTTYAMPGSWHLYRIPVSQAQRGDLLFWGSGHVEFKTVWWDTSFGAQESGTRIWWHGYRYWYPTSAYRIR